METILKNPSCDDELKRRAIAAFCRNTRYPETYSQPGWAESTTEKHCGKLYAVLRNGNGLLAVYRVRPNGMLKRLKRWPKAI
jgi:hypothetical protein